MTREATIIIQIAIVLIALSALAFMTWGWHRGKRGSVSVPIFVLLLANLTLFNLYRLVDKVIQPQFEAWSLLKSVVGSNQWAIMIQLHLATTFLIVAILQARKGFYANTNLD